jgi:hypothetical protein
MERAVGPTHPDVAAILNSLAAIAQDRGEYFEAEGLLSRSALILDAVDGDDPDVARLRIRMRSLRSGPPYAGPLR